MSLEVFDVLNAAGGKIIDDEYFVTALQARVGKMRADETCSAGNQNSQMKVLSRKESKISNRESNTNIRGWARQGCLICERLV